MRWVPPTNPGVPHGQSKEQGWSRRVRAVLSQGVLVWLGQGDGVSARHGCPQVPAVPSLAGLGTARMPALW